MKKPPIGMRCLVAAVLASTCIAHVLAAPSGTLQTRLVTFSDTAGETVTFKVSNILSSGDAASLLLDFAADGNGNASPADPFPTPASVTFKLQYNGADITPDNGKPAFNFTAQDMTGAGVSTASAGKLDLTAKKAGTGRYTLTLTLKDTGATLNQNWTLIMSGLQGGSPVRGTAYVDQGTFSNVSTPAACGGGVQNPTCPVGQSCQFPCPLPPPPPWWRFIEYVEVIPWPIPPPPCLSCPFQWQKPVLDGFERALVSVAPSTRDGQLLGPGKAREITMNIRGAEPVGDLVDAGEGQYLQMMEFRKGSPPTVTATAAGITSPSLFVGAPRRGGYSTLELVLGFLLVLALATIGYLLTRGGRRHRHAH